MRAVDRIWIATAVAGVIGAMTLLPLTADASYLYPSWLLIAVLSVAAVVGDRLRLAKVIVNGIQVLLAGALAISLAIGPGPADVAWYARLVPLLRSGYNHIQTSAAPMDPDPGAQIILTIIVVLLFLVAGIIADTLEKPAWTLAPLLALYLIPAIALRTDVNVISFLVVVIGYLAILFADGLNSDRRWTRNLSHDSAMSRGSRGIWRLSVVVATPTLIGAIVLGIVLPTLSPTFFTSLRPNGTGPIEMVDPQLDLRKNLEQGASREVLSYTTNKASGTYLRLATLPVLNADGWAQSQVTLKQGGLGSVPGVTTPPSGGARVTNIQIDDFASMYLPAPYAPRAQTATGEWSYDPASLMIIATGTNRARATVGQRYTVESWDIEPNGAALSTAKVGVPDGQSMTLDLPTDIPPQIVQLVTQLTTGIDQPALKAAALQAYLRSSPFSYSVQGASGQTSYDAIATFLFKTKTGYCVQYAAAMALMARIAGIPSRVAVGFLPGTQSGDRWLVTSHDMHAWPELYFEGQGWVRFEPTPSVAVPPPWTVVALNQPSVAPSTVAEPSASSSVQPSAQATEQHQSPSSVGITSAEASRIRTEIVLAVVGLVLLLLLLAPMVARRLLRRARLGPAPDPHESIARAWLEVRDTWLDLGHRWPQGTPRQIADVVGKRLPDGVAETSLSGVVAAVEQSRYSEHLDDVEGLRRQVDAVLSGLDASRPWYRRLGHVIVPASLTYAARQWWGRITTRPALETPIDETTHLTSPEDEAYQRPVGSAANR
jgi:transglutaminase-like putative cysteine protease